MVETKNVGEVSVNLTLNTDKFKSSANQVKGELDKLQQKCKETGGASAYIKEGFSQIGDKLTGLISPANVVAAGLAAIAGACASVAINGEKMQEIFDDLQVATGALGDSLESLNQSLRTTMRDSSTTADKLGGAIGNLNTYLGLTGDEVENLAVLFAKYSDITGKDVLNATEKASKAFNLWGVETKDMERIMNDFYGISQATGIGVEELFTAVTDGAAFMSRFGYTIEEAGIELASFEKFGISSATVLTGMKMAISHMTEQGIEPNKEAWDNLKDSIANATSDADAMNIAMKMFGSRYAADMVDAIKLADKAVGQLGDNMEGLNTALQDSIDLQEGGLQENLTKLSNRFAMGADAIWKKLEPALAALVEGFIALLDILDPVFRFIGMLIDVALVPLQAIITVIGNALQWLYENVLKPLSDWVNGFLDAIQPIIDFFGGIGEGIAKFFGFTSDGSEEAKDGIDNVGKSISKATDSMNTYCSSIDKAIDKTNQLTAASGSGEDPYVNTGMNYHIENGYKIYADGTRVKEGGTTYNNSITVQGGGYPSEEMARVYAYNQALNALKARY